MYVTSQLPPNQPLSVFSRNANGFSKQPENQRQLNTKNGVDCTTIQREPVNRNPCSIILEVRH